MAKQDRVVIKKVANAVWYSDGTIRIDNVRASFPHLAEPYVSPDDAAVGKKGKFGIVAMLPKDTHKAAKDLVKELIEKLLADNRNAKVPTQKWCLSDGDQGEREEGMGHFLISARESKRPSCRNKRAEVMTPDEVSEMFYGGCYVNVLIRPWYQDGVKVGAGFGKRVNAGLVAVQFCRDGDAFGEGRVDDEGVFDVTDDGMGGDDDEGGL
jgi:hypothetical protein